jgi:ABC-type multidrug transport system ATPase subunit
MRSHLGFVFYFLWIFREELTIIVKLDSTSAREVMVAIRTLAVAEGMIVLATIHQPSLETIAQFTNIIFLSAGKTCFFGAVNDLEGFFEKWGRPVDRFV